jgi:OmpA-OmpF porin, OOP family
MNRLTGGALAIVACATAGPAYAQDGEYTEDTTTRQYLSPMASYLRLDKDRELDNYGAGASLIYGRQLSDHWWWETEGGGYILERGIKDQPDFYQGTVSTGLAYAFGDRTGFTPFVLAAIGVVYNDVIPDADDSYEFHANVGLGAVTGPLFDNGLKLRMEARYLYDNFDGIRGTASEDQGGFSDWRFSLGFEIPLGYRQVVERVVVETREVERVVERPVVDTDGDGVPDDRDRCPNTISGARVDADGCMIMNQTIVLNTINFELNSDQITPSSRPSLDQTVRSLQEQPEVTMEIAGHTDSTGSDAYNQQLSQRRADSVRNYLTSQGVDAGRVRATGYGEQQPIASNETASGRAMNRRVEFRVSGESRSQ